MDSSSQVNKYYQIKKAFASSQRGGATTTEATGLYTGKEQAGESKPALSIPAWESDGDGCRKGGDGGSSSSLVNKCATSARWGRRQKRAYHRVMSGFHRKGQYQFVTLTSSPQSKRRAQDDWRVLKERLRRRGLLDAYFCVPEYTNSGLVHLHLIWRGSYVAQILLSRWWAEIHQAPVVWIQRVKGKRRAVGKYVTKYVAKELPLRWSCSWSWVWRGFCKSWEFLKQILRIWYPQDWRKIALHQWRWHCEAGIPP